MNINQLLTHFILEMMGTALLYISLVVPLTLSNDSYLIAPFFGVAAVASCYRATGGQLNPIVSLVNAFRKDKPEGFDVVTNLVYILAQFIGAAIGGILCWWFTTNTYMVLPNQGGKEATDYLISECCGYTFFLAFILTLVYLTMSSQDTAATKDTGMQSVIIGFTYAALPIWSIAEVGGGFINPWIDFWVSMFSLIDLENDEESWEYMYINLIVPWFGAILAFGIHQFLLLPGSQKAARDIEANGEVVQIATQR